MKIAYQSGTSSTNLVEDLSGFFEPLWFTRDGIANVLSLASVRRYFKVKYKAESGGAMFTIHMPNWSIEFWESPDGLYYLNFEGGGKEMSLVTTVRD